MCVIGILAQIVVALHAPLVKIVLGNYCLQIVAAGVGRVQSKSLMVPDVNFLAGSLIENANFACPDHQLHRIGTVTPHAEASGLMQQNGFLRSIYLERAAVLIGDFELNFALGYVDGGKARALVRELQLGENNFALRGQTHGAAIFKLDFCPSVFACSEARAPGNRHIDGRALVTGAVVDIYLAFDVTDAHNAYVGLRRCCGNQHGRQKN